MDGSLLEVHGLRYPVDRHGEVPLLVVVSSEDKVRVGEVLLVDVGTEDTLRTFGASAVPMMVVDVETLTAGAVAVRGNTQPPSVASYLYVSAVAVYDLRDPVDGETIMRFSMFVSWLPLEINLMTSAYLLSFSPTS